MSRCSFVFFALSLGPLAAASASAGSGALVPTAGAGGGREGPNREVAEGAAGGGDIGMRVLNITNARGTLFQI